MYSYEDRTVWPTLRSYLRPMARSTELRTLVVKETRRV